MEPDISSYIVCSNISTACSTINVTEAGRDSSDLRQYMFPNLRVYINFTVTAVNIVGDGESVSIVSEPCDHLRGKYDSSRASGKPKYGNRSMEVRRKCHTDSRLFPVAKG